MILFQNKNKFLTFIGILAMLCLCVAGGPVRKANADDAEVLTSSDISIRGFQMKANESYGISFRAVGKVPQLGGTVTAGGKDYIVKDVGIIYVLDPDYSGVGENRKLDDSYTILNPATLKGVCYTGAKTYDNELRTYGYIATENAILDVVEDEDTSYVYYAMTMTKMEKKMVNTLLVRAFIVATDGTIIYGENTKVTSIAKIAYQLYTGNMVGDAATHSYLYQKILNSETLAEVYRQNPNYPFYLTEEREFGWGGIYVPNK